MKPRVLHLIESAGLYGAEQVIMTLARAQHAAANVEPVIGCIINNPQDTSALYDLARAQGIAAIKILLPMGRLPLALIRAKQLLRDQQVALIHCHGYKPAVLGFLLAKMTRLPIISSCHNWILPPNAPLKMRAMIWLELKLYRFFDHIVAVSGPIQKKLLTTAAAPNKISLIYNGIALPLSQVDSNRADTRAQLGINPQTFVILQLARLSEVKEQATLIRAFAKVHHRHPDSQLLIAGDGPLRASLQSLIAELKLAQAVKLLGFRRDSAALLHASDCFCLVSRDEGMPISLLEACAARCPVIATPVGSIPEIIVDQYSGRLVPVGDINAQAQALTATLKDSERAQQMAQQAYATINTHFSAQQISARYQEIYRELLPA